MTIAQQYFLVVADELNISKAAKKLFISQQCLSTHIKKLENSYGTLLLERRPHLKLTPAGDLLYSTLRQFQILENNLHDGIQEISQGSNSIFRIGIHSWRAQVILPHILPSFQQHYPSLKIKIYSNVAAELELMLLDGKVDIVIARIRTMDDRIHRLKLFNEPLYLSISDTLLKKYFPNQYPECKQTFKSGINIKDFAHVPFVLPLENSNAYADEMEYFSIHGVIPKCFLQTNISEMHTGMSGLEYGAGFCPMTMLSLLNRNPEYSNINIFPLNNFTGHNFMQLAYLSNAYLPGYAKEFISLTQNYFQTLTDKSLSQPITSLK